MSDVLVLMTVRFPEPLLQRVRAVSPRLQVEVHPASEASELPGHLLPDVEILYTVRALPDPEAAPSLRWIQFHYAGIDHVADHPLLKGDVRITTLSVAAVPQMAEFVLMAILGLGRRLPRLERTADKRWAENRFRSLTAGLEGSTVESSVTASAARWPGYAAASAPASWPPSATSNAWKITTTPSRTSATRMRTLRRASIRRKPWRR
jgi:phosphoglycerate dehydrogenase-like enzyme